MVFKNSPKSFQGIPQCERVAGCEDDKQSLLSALNSKVKITHVGATSYPNYLIPNSPIEILYLSPFRMIYLIVWYLLQVLPFIRILRYFQYQYSLH